MHDKILLITAACYLVAVILLYLAMAEGSKLKRIAAAGITLTGVILHVWAESQHWVIPTSPQVSLLNILSLCALVTVAIPLGTFPLKNSLFDASLVALPISVIILIGEGMITAPVLEITSTSGLKVDGLSQGGGRTEIRSDRLVYDEEKALASLQCHKSQFTEQVMKDWIQAEKKDTTNVLYFRKFAVDTLIRDGF